MLTGLKIKAFENSINSHEEFIQTVQWPLTRRQYLYSTVRYDTKNKQFVVEVQKDFGDHPSVTRLNRELFDIGDIEKIQFQFVGSSIPTEDVDPIFFEERYRLDVTYKDPNKIEISYILLINQQRIQLQHVDGLAPCWVNPVLAVFEKYPELKVPGMLVQVVDGDRSEVALVDRTARLPIQVIPYPKLEEVPAYFLNLLLGYKNIEGDIRENIANELANRKPTNNIVQLRRAQ